jgi:hypothetical protein
MMPNTFELIASVVVPSNQTSIDFTSIPSTYTDLCLKLSARGTLADPVEFVTIKLNNSSTGFASRFMRGRGSGTPDSYTDTTLVPQIVGANATSVTYNNADFYFPNYAGSTNKSYSMDSVTENNATLADAVLGAGLWSNTSAINRITLTVDSGRFFVSSSTAYLYGVKNA